ncbi:T9SS C-terminal target domain-containing protein, partial [Bacteroidetes/Chlorobi group bacterium ChocPot_Mid]
PSAAPVIAEPANGASGVDRTLLLKWNTVQYATEYELLVSKKNDFSSDIVVNEPMVYNNQKSIGGLEYDETYYWKVKAKNASGSGPWSETYSFKVKTLGSVNDEALARFKVNAYPNPFNESNILSFSLVNNSRVVIKMYNLSGVEVETLLNKDLPAGEHSVSWRPKGLESGVYFYSIQIGDTKFVKEVKFIK